MMYFVSSFKCKGRTPSNWSCITSIWRPSTTWKYWGRLRMEFRFTPNTVDKLGSSATRWHWRAWLSLLLSWKSSSENLIRQAIGTYLYNTYYWIGITVGHISSSGSGSSPIFSISMCDWCWWGRVFKLEVYVHIQGVCTTMNDYIITMFILIGWLCLMDRVGPMNYPS